MEMIVGRRASDPKSLAKIKAKSIIEITME
jgi:hypothetical protein